MQGSIAALLSTLVPGLLLAGAGNAPGAEATGPGFTEREIRFTSGETVLAGTLTVPDRPGPHPAIVYLHGSGPMDRGGFAPDAQRWAALGVAGLRYDKRGTGESGGDWRGASLTDLAADAVAAMRFLGGLPEIAVDRIGLWGVSQGCWVATEATSFTADVAFLVAVSGGGVSPYESEAFSYRGAFDRAGLSAADRAEGLAMVDRYMHFLATGEGREELSKALEGSRDAAWFEHAPLDRILPRTEAGRRAWSWVASWDPAPRIARMRFPVLVLFGDRDTEAPADASVSAWRRGLETAGNREYTIRRFPEAGHGIRVWKSGHHEGGQPPLAAGYLEAVESWLVEHVVP